MAGQMALLTVRCKCSGEVFLTSRGRRDLELRSEKLRPVASDWMGGPVGV